MVYLGGGIIYCIKPFQEKTLAVIDPLAGNSHLNKCEYRFTGYML